MLYSLIWSIQQVSKFVVSFNAMHFYIWGIWYLDV